MTLWVKSLKSSSASLRLCVSINLSLLVLFYFLQCRLSSCEPSNRHPVRAATDVVQTYHVAELDGGWVAAVLAADAYFEIGTGLAALLYGGADEAAYAVAVEHLEGIFREDFALHVLQQELAF